MFFDDLQRGDAKLVDGHSFRDYINDYQNSEENKKINALVDDLGVDKSLLIELMSSVINEKNINQFGRFDNLKATVDIDKAKAYFESEEGRTIPPFKLRIKVDKHLQGFILED